MLNIFSLTPTGPLQVNWSTPIHQCSVQGEWVLEIKEMKSATKIFFTVAVSDMLEKYKKNIYWDKNPKFLKGRPHM